MFFATAVLLESQDSATLQARADAARDANRLEEAVSLYKKALAVRPDWAEGWWSVGTIYYDRDAYADAASALAKAAALNPRAGVAFVMLGLAEAKLGRDRSALEHIETGRKLGISENARLKRVMLYTQGTLQLSAGEFGKAQETLGALARDGVDDEDLIFALGLAVIGLRPADVSNHDPVARTVVRRAGWAERLAARSEFGPASVEYATLAADYPHFRNLQFAYGRFLVNTHQDEKAIQAFEREIQNTPNHLLARLGIAGLKLVSDPPAGIPYAEQAVKLAPKLAEGHYLLGALLLATGDRARAVRELEIARTAAPNEAKVHLALARAYAAADRPADAARARAMFKRLNDSEENQR